MTTSFKEDTTPAISSLTPEEEIACLVEETRILR